eukprot:GILJ01006094.1.p1 GENE.GILJ01006094.1~~GILJ01006094.1.p1  ORF type:complete len:583 (-),score=152.42 GILJ01006094.1:122-1870(-)
MESEEDAEAAAKDEEEEALKIQKKHLSTLDKDDFAVSLGEQVEKNKYNENDKKKGSRKADPKSDSALLASVNNDLNSISLQMDGIAVETVKKDTTKLSETDKLKIVKRDSPELLQLLQEFKGKIEELKSQIEPLTTRVKNNELLTAKGVSYLEVKLHLLLTYCINLSFYLVLKAEGKSIKDHPVIGQLVHIRTILEKLRPLDQKLKYQLDKLLTMPTEAVVSNGNGASAEASADPLRFKPNVRALDSKINDSMREDSDEVYKAPKMAAVQFEEVDAATKKQQRDLDRLKRKAAKSQILRDLREELSEKPEEISEKTNIHNYVDDEEEHRNRFEEENFVRVQVSRKDKKLSKRKALEATKLHSYEDFADFGDLLQQEKEEDAADLNLMRKKSLGQYISQIEGARKGKKTLTGDEDLPRRDRDRSTRSTRTDDPDDDAALHFGGGGSDEDGMDMSMDNGKAKKGGKRKANLDEEDDFYKDVAASKQQIKRAKQDIYEHKPVLPGAQAETDGQRGVSFNIMKNKGLTRKRSKENRNARVKNKNKYAKAVVNRKGAVRPMLDRSTAYAGETSGIKSNVVRSVAFNK